MMERRSFLKGAAALSLTGAGWLPQAVGSAGATVPQLPNQASGLAQRSLVLLELNGGWDGLSVVVPFGDPAYGRQRKRLAVARDKVLRLDHRLGLAPELEPLMPVWQAGELAVALGVGYPRPNRSHFRSIEIWNSASATNETLSDGWLARGLGEAGLGRARLDALGLAADGAVLGGPLGPLAGARLRTVVLRNPERFGRRAARLGTGPAGGAGNPALDHILTLRAGLHDSARAIQDRLKGAPDLAADFPPGDLGRQLELAARLIAAGVPIPVLKLQQGGYDTHAGQAGRLPGLLRDLAGGLAAFRAALQRTGAWDRVLVMTYGEFGRRVAKNASGGTDHGTAAPHLILGGRVKAGLYGRQPSLGDLEGGDLKHTLDFRALYATALQGWWGLPPTPETLAGQRPLPCLT